MKVTILGKPDCKFCRLARQLARKSSHKWVYHDLTKNRSKEIKHYFDTEGFETVPQIWVNGKHIGGYQEYAKLVEESEDVRD
jgi:glutaredoxin